MQHYVAFLRGINLGNRRLKMDELRARFVELKFADVTTFIASGNVIFSSKASDGRKLARHIEQHLAQTLGYEVDTFVRTRAEVAAVAAFRPFSAADLAQAHAVYVVFLGDELSPAQARGLLACRTDAHEFRAEGREYYWLCREKSPEAWKIWASPGMKALKLPSSSMRNLTTLRKLAALYPVPSR